MEIECTTETILYAVTVTVIEYIAGILTSDVAFVEKYFLETFPEIFQKTGKNV